MLLLRWFKSNHFRWTWVKNPMLAFWVDRQLYLHTMCNLSFVQARSILNMVQGTGCWSNNHRTFLDVVIFTSKNREGVWTENLKAYSKECRMTEKLFFISLNGKTKTLLLLNILDVADKEISSGLIATLQPSRSCVKNTMIFLVKVKPVSWM